MAVDQAAGSVRDMAGRVATRPIYTHFLSIPLFHRESMEVPLADLKRRILADKIDGVDSSIFVTPEMMHLTIGMLSLRDKASIGRAVDLLRAIEPQILAALPETQLMVHLDGLRIMREDAARAHVLYLHVKENEALMHICQLVRQLFRENGIFQEEGDDELLLHATFMNSKYRDDPKGKKHHRRIPFDARRILRYYGDFELPPIPATALHVSNRTAPKDISGYYRCEGFISLIKEM